MHKEILTDGQIQLLPLIKSFSKNFSLAGGTAIAFYIGHRRSIDFDLFTNKEFNNLKIRKQVSQFAKIEKTFINDKGEYTILVNGIRITFFQYSFKIDYPEKFEDIIRLPDLLTLAAMKAFTLGMRAKWKDYVDLYFVMKDYFPINKIVKRAEKIFGMEFNEKRFRAQLSYFNDIDNTEEIIYLEGFRVDDEIIKKSLIDFSLRSI